MFEEEIPVVSLINLNGLVIIGDRLIYQNNRFYKIIYRIDSDFYCMRHSELKCYFICGLECTSNFTTSLKWFLNTYHFKYVPYLPLY